MDQKNNNYYSKRPLWQWILIYIVIGAIVYGAIYYFFMKKNGGYDYSNTGSQNNNLYNYNK
jgi:flagellar basal body-associated protein FliL